jgi:hypothetical protein
LNSFARERPHVAALWPSNDQVPVHPAAFVPDVDTPFRDIGPGTFVRSLTLLPYPVR